MTTCAYPYRFVLPKNANASAKLLALVNTHNDQLLPLLRYTPAQRKVKNNGCMSRLTGNLTWILKTWYSTLSAGLPDKLNVENQGGVGWDDTITCRDMQWARVRSRFRQIGHVFVHTDAIAASLAVIDPQNDRPHVAKMRFNPRFRESSRRIQNPSLMGM